MKIKEKIKTLCDKTLYNYFISCKDKRHYSYKYLTSLNFKLGLLSILLVIFFIILYVFTLFILL